MTKLHDFNQHPYKREVFIAWDELQKDARSLCQQLLPLGPWQGLIAITRGGLIPAGIVARELGIHHIQTLCLSSYDGLQMHSDGLTIIHAPKIAEGGQGFLLVDDLVDTGKTAEVARKLFPKAYFATLYTKPQGQHLVDLSVRHFEQDTWVRFPWDTALNFSTPMVERTEVVTTEPSLS